MNPTPPAMSEQPESYESLLGKIESSGYPNATACYGAYSPHHSFDYHSKKCYYCSKFMDDVAKRIWATQSAPQPAAEESVRKTFTCHDCGWQWLQGENGNHDCKARLLVRLDRVIRAKEAADADLATLRPSPVDAAWHPIETAPKDGTAFIGKFGGLVFRTHWQAYNLWGPEKPGGGCDVIGQRFSWTYSDSDRLIPEDPTHWMPMLGIAPSATAGVSDGERDTQRLFIVNKFHLTVGRSGYRGRDGWEVHVADPGGHYQEERTKTIGYGETATAAIDKAIESLGQRAQDALSAMTAANQP